MASLTLSPLGSLTPVCEVMARLLRVEVLPAVLGQLCVPTSPADPEERSIERLSHHPKPPSLDGPREGDESSSGRMHIQPIPAARSLHKEIYKEDGPRDPGFQPYPKPLPIQAAVPSLGFRVGSRGPLSKGRNLLTLN